MKDLTIIYYTANVLKKRFDDKIREQLIKAKGDYPLISVSQKPMDFGENICVGRIGVHHLNIYKQILIGAKAAKTKYVALAEDDTLYSPSHFNDFRPPEDAFAYDMTRWSLFTWKKIYSVVRRASNATLIAPRKLLIEELEERFEKSPRDQLKFWGEPGRYSKNLKVTPRKIVEFYSYNGVVIFFHPEALGYGRLQTRKRTGNYRAYDIPYWGHVDDLIKVYK